MEAYAPFIPELIILGAALLALFADRLPGEDLAAPRIGAVAAGIAALCAALIGVREGLAGGGVLAFDEVAVVARTAIAGLSGLYLLWLSGRGGPIVRVREAAALALFATLGAMLMAASRELITLFISTELATMPAYVLMGYRRDDARELEGALKYYLLSMTTSLVMLYGFSLIYGLAGSTAFASIGALRETPSLLGAFAVVFAFVGLFAKISAAPVHYWAPDAYAGAPSSSVAFVSTVPKVAGTAALVHIAAATAGTSGIVPALLMGGAIASMVIGNLAAYPQTDIRRLMAYSGVAHTGYALVALTALEPAGFAAALIHTVAYAIPSMAVMLIAAEEGCALDEIGGLVARRAATAWALAAFLLSLIGIPPLVGFFGKLLAFTAAFAAGGTAVVIVAVTMSVISAGYYFRLIRQAFFGDGAAANALPASRARGAAIALALIVTLALGVLASPIVAYLGGGF